MNYPDSTNEFPPAQWSSDNARVIGSPLTGESMGKLGDLALFYWGEMNLGEVETAQAVRREMEQATDALGIQRPRIEWAADSVRITFAERSGAVLGVLVLQPGDVYISWTGPGDRFPMIPFEHGFN